MFSSRGWPSPGFLSHSSAERTQQFLPFAHLWVFSHVGLHAVFERFARPRQAFLPALTTVGKRSLFVSRGAQARYLCAATEALPSRVRWRVAWVREFCGVTAACCLAGSCCRALGRALSGLLSRRSRPDGTERAAPVARARRAAASCLICAIPTKKQNGTAATFGNDVRIPQRLVAFSKKVNQDRNGNRWTSPLNKRAVHMYDRSHDLASRFLGAVCSETGKGERFTHRCSTEVTRHLNTTPQGTAGLSAPRPTGPKHISCTNT